ncbi:ATP-binding cassette domain-containing protein [Streptomyces sp. NPDC008121]|uniref:ATP-binding cassette domain-containing protein n=1 Tax=Streptomyces sp. NPDC008121 TaxID=3364809 RepID=UPI0036DFFD6B
MNASIAASQLAVITGPPRSGKTSLMLALAGRFKLATGSVYVPGTTASHPVRQLQSRFSVARARPAVDLDDHLQIEELISERRATAGRTVTPQAVWDACALLSLDVPPARTLLSDISTADATLLCLALALAEKRDGLIIDDIDLGLDPSATARIWQALRTITDTGRTVIATAVQDHGADVTIPLSHTRRHSFPAKISGAANCDSESNHADGSPSETGAAEGEGGSRPAARGKEPSRRTSPSGHRTSVPPATSPGSPPLRRGTGVKFRPPSTKGRPASTPGPSDVAISSADSRARTADLADDTATAGGQAVGQGSADDTAPANASETKPADAPGAEDQPPEAPGPGTSEQAAPQPTALDPLGGPVGSSPPSGPDEGQQPGRPCQEGHAP